MQLQDVLLSVCALFGEASELVYIEKEGKHQTVVRIPIRCSIIVTCSVITLSTNIGYFSHKFTVRRVVYHSLYNYALSITVHYYEYKYYFTHS